MGRKVKIKKEDIILEALIEWFDDDFKTSRAEAKKNPTEVTNPHFWEKPQFVSLNYIDQYNNICITETQAGVDPSEPNYTIGVAVPYVWYKPYHDKYMKMRNRIESIDSLVK
jgi:hypothetical protein